MKTKIKIAEDFDCVKMMRDIRDQMYQETKDLSSEEYKAYIKRQSKLFKK